MGHKNWCRIDNTFNFDRKVKLAQQQVHRILGRVGCTTFYKKFLIKKVELPRKASNMISDG